MLMLFAKIAASDMQAVHRGAPAGGGRRNLVSSADVAAVAAV
jgi:hypothetical protein